MAEDRTYDVWVCSGCGRQSSWNENGYYYCPSEWMKPPPGESGPRPDPSHQYEQEPSRAVPLARLEEVQAATAAFTQEAMAIASTLLSWRQGPQGDNDLVWQHNDKQVWGRLEALLERGRAVRARLVDDGEQV